MSRTVPLILLFTLLHTGCSSILLPESIGEQSTSESYVPIDPLRVEMSLGSSCNPGTELKDLMKIEDVFTTPLQTAMPDQTVRMATRSLNGSVNVGFGASKVAVKGETYDVVVDYAASDVVSASFYVRRTVASQVANEGLFGAKYIWPEFKDGTPLSIHQLVPETVISAYEILPVPQEGVFEGAQPDPLAGKSDRERALFELISLPIYIGYGLRITATVEALQAGAKLNGIAQIAAEASAGRLTGTMVVQSLGVTGELVSTNLPLPSELDRSTAQMAILSIGSIKALLHDPDMKIYPRVLGFYNQVGGGQQFVNQVISALAAYPVSWDRPCDYIFRESQAADLSGST